MSATIATIHAVLLGAKTDRALHRLTLVVAVGGFVVHLSLWLLTALGILTPLPEAEGLLNSPLAALYTPFSVLLAYEVYQLVRAIPESFSTAVGKQYEVATLLVVRDVFKRLADVRFDGEWTLDGELGLIVVECLTFLVLFFTALSYQRARKVSYHREWEAEELDAFVKSKMAIAVMLAFTLGVVGLSAFAGWSFALAEGRVDIGREIFFSDFFTCLILADILILLISYRHATDFYALVRNTGFVLSTVILRVAISAPGLSSMVLFIVSGLLGVVLLHLINYFQAETQVQNAMKSSKPAP